jgi:GxxExxY protein
MVQFDRLAGLNKQYEPDMVCIEKIVVELKAVSTITDDHRAQLINYLRGLRMKLGLLVNYGRPGGLQHERIVL